MENFPEPWLRGALPEVNPLVSPILYAFQQAREDLTQYTEPLSTERLWATPFGLGSAGFHVLHIAGSIDRLMTYLQGKQLSSRQMSALEGEQSPPPIGRDRPQMRHGVHSLHSPPDRQNIAQVAGDMLPIILPSSGDPVERPHVIPRLAQRLHLPAPDMPGTPRH